MAAPTTEFSTFSDEECMDSVHFWLYPLSPGYTCPTSVQETLQDRKSSYLAHLSPHTIDYIWQNEAFNLRVVTCPSCRVSCQDGVSCYLEGEVKFGDNIQDEWFITWLLFQLSRAFPELVFRLEDNDGQFLLIEAADFLPEWLEPETSENRVWIKNGKLHIIAPDGEDDEEKMAAATQTPALSDALRLVRSSKCETEADAEIQQQIATKIGKYPEEVGRNLHRTHCFLPAATARLLQNNRNFLSWAIKAFRHREPRDVKTCRVMRLFPPETRVMCEVVFTRFLYAELLQMLYRPEKIVGWNVPSPSHAKHKAYDLGAKLACGFEIVCSRAASSGKLSQRGSWQSQKIRDEPAERGNIHWDNFLSKLHKHGYFQGEIDGSKLHQSLLSKAKDFYRNSVENSDISRNSVTEQRQAPEGSAILDALSDLEYDFEEMQKAGENLRKPDDDSWMEISPTDLDDLLVTSSGRPLHPDTLAADVDIDEESEHEQAAGARDLHKVVTSVGSFVNKVSGYRGAEFTKCNQKKQRVNFSGDDFTETMKGILDLSLGECSISSESEDDMSEYGSESRYGKDLDREMKGKESEQHSDNTREPSIESYMEQMDRELAKTNVGKSFERIQEPVKDKNEEDVDNEKSSEPPPRSSPQLTANGKESVSSSPQDDGSTPQASSSSATDEEEAEALFGSRSAGGEVGSCDDGGYRPVDVELTVAKNLLDSYSGQRGAAGPTSNLLHSMAIRLPLNADLEEFSHIDSSDSD